jgi:hypothetical protein
MKRFRWLLWTVVFGLIGAFLISVLVHYTFAATAPKMQNDGQYVLIFLLTSLVGWLIGAGLSALPSSHRRRKSVHLARDASLRLCTLLGLFLCHLPLYIALTSSGNYID